MPELHLSCQGCLKESLSITGMSETGAEVHAQREGWNLNPALCPECKKARDEEEAE